MKLCIIPARGGSKRIPRKNIKDFLGKPIIAYSIEAATQSGCFDKVIVSTDDEEIAKVAKRFGAEVPFIRPTELANDFAETIPVIKHAIEWFEEQVVKIDYVCCLYATAPFVTPAVLQAAFTQLITSQAGFCFSVTPYPSPIQRAIKITESERIEMFNPQMFNMRSQDLEEAYHDAGQFYWGKASAFKEQHRFYSEEASPYIVPGYLVQDLDNLDDWIRAEMMYQVLQNSGGMA